MNIVVSVQDQDQNTDNIVLVNTLEKTLTWIPRDLFSLYLWRKINRAFYLGGHALLLRALKKLGFYGDYSVCVSNEVTRAVLRNYKITVPVEYAADYYYPLKAFEPIENGKKTVSFRPPYETLSGERIHQFLGARYRVHKNEYVDLPDFERIARQMLFVKQMLLEKFDFRVFLNSNLFISHPQAIDYLSQVDATYECTLYRNCNPYKINGAMALIQKSKFSTSFGLFILKCCDLLVRALRKSSNVVLSYVK